MERLTMRDENGDVRFRLSALKPFDHPRVMGMEKLFAYEDAEEQGLLVRLPCKVGDTVFWVERGIRTKEIVEFTIDEFSVDSNGAMAVLSRVKPTRRRLCAFYLEDFGKTVFLTREEAEAALAKEENNDTQN